MDANFSAAGEARAPSRFVGDAEAQRFRAPGFDDVERRRDDVGFDAAAGNGALKLVDAGDRHLAAGAHRGRAPSVDDGRNGDGPAGFEPSPGGGARRR